MSYELEFHPEALTEWKKLPKSIGEQFKNVLKRQLENPFIPSAKLHGRLKNCYKIKLLKAGHRLVYRVINNPPVLTVMAVGKRENNYIYELAGER